MAMKNEDMKIKSLYENVYDDVCASDELFRKVRSMRNVNAKKSVKRTVKVACALVAAAALTVAGCVVGSAKRGYKGEYQTVVLNGQETQARYGKLNDHCYTFEATENKTTYSVWFYGDYNKDQDTIYIVDEGDYIVCSTDPNPTLNLYDEIDNAAYATLFDPNTIKIPVIVNGEQLNTILLDLTFDERDGARDGLINDKYSFGDSEDFFKTFTVTPEGALIQAFKGPESRGDSMEILWGIIWGEESPDAAVEYAASH